MNIINFEPRITVEKPYYENKLNINSDNLKVVITNFSANDYVFTSNKLKLTFTAK